RVGLEEVEIREGAPGAQLEPRFGEQERAADREGGGEQLVRGARRHERDWSSLSALRSIRMNRMIRSNMLNDVWAYLPAFRAVAESEPLPTAAAELHVVPSALSRSVRLLEEALGERLFTRRGRRLALNSRGRALLDAIRQGQRSLEHALRRGESTAFEGELRVGTIGVLTNHVVLPALLELSSVHPALVPAMKNFGARAANHHL